MSRRTFAVLLGAALFVLFAFSLAPGARAATDAANVSGTLYTLDLKAKTIVVRKSDATTVTLKISKATKILRNGKNTKFKNLVLQDALQVKFKGKGALQIKATGAASQKVAGKLNDVSLGNGTVVINGKTVQTTAQTRISRNGKLVSLGSLSRQDTLLAHVSKSATEASGDALDLIANGPDDGEVHGLISALGTDQVTITPDNGTTDVTLNVTADTMIEIDGEHAAFADLAVGQQVEAHYDTATNNAFSIESDSKGEANDAHITGTVSAVDLGANTVTITPETGDPVTLNVDASTHVKVNHANATIADIQVGMPALAEYDSATLLASEIKAGDGDDNHEDDHIQGTVAAVDVDAQTITITPNGGGDNVTLHVTTETELEVNGEHGSLADIQIGDTVRAEYDAATLDAFEIKVGDEQGNHGDSDEVEGPITAIYLDAQSVTIDPASGDPVTVLVVGSTEIKVQGKSAAIGDLQVGDQAHARYAPDSMEAREIKVGNTNGGGGGDDNDEVTGEITAIDLDALSVTIDPAEGDAVTVLVVDGTEIKVNGAHSEIGDLTVGDQAQAEYDLSSMEASEIKVGENGGGGDH